MEKKIMLDRNAHFEEIQLKDEKCLFFHFGLELKIY